MSPAPEFPNLQFRSAQAQPVGGLGTQFITGACTSDAICASGCCGFRSGKCAGAIIAQERDGGCGFGDAQPNDNAARLLRGGGGQAAPSGFVTVTSTKAAVGTPAPAPANGNGNGNGQQIAAGTQFITGVCAKDAECASKCCGFNSGKCAGPIVAQERDGGCGFGDEVPNDDAARALRGAK